MQPFAAKFMHFSTLFQSTLESEDKLQAERQCRALQGVVQCEKNAVQKVSSSLVDL